MKTPESDAKAGVSGEGFLCRRRMLTLSHLIGLHREKMRARIEINACQKTGEAFSHTLLTGYGGCGKTALARAIGNELGYHFVEVEGIVYKHRGDLVKALLNHTSQAQRLGRFLLLFIDEIHRLKPTVQEALYLPMKEWKLTTTEGEIRLPFFTVFGATTRFDMLDSNSFVTRFGNLWEIQRYDLDDMAAIVASELRKLNLSFTRDVVYAIAQRSLGIPRIAADTLVPKIRLSVLAEGGAEVTMYHCENVFDLEGIDHLGLNDIHRRYLSIVSSAVLGGKPMPLGVGSIAGKMRQPEDVITGSVEPILLEMELIASTPRGRVITQAGTEYLKKVTEVV